VRANVSILHVDLDAFFAAVEQLDDPSLRATPVVVGGLGNRGVVSTASYEAREYGVHSAMPMARARRACPHATFLSPRFARYQEKSEEVMAILHSVTPLVEPLSIDEAFLDVAGARRLLGEPEAVATTIRARVRDETGLTISVGAATTKFLAKLASDMAKPDGLLAIAPGTETAFLAPLPVTRLWGVGPATLKKLDRIGLRTIGDVAALDEAVLQGALGASLGAHLYALANNIDDREIVTDREAKSIGAEETFERDLHDRDECEHELVRLVDRVCARARKDALVARTVTLKIRFGNFETRTRARTLPDATDISTVFLATVREQLAQFEVARGVRLLGVSLSQLAPRPEVQTALDLRDNTGGTEKRAAVEDAVHNVRDRFGAGAVQPARLTGGDSHR
jgi:DNA polymerase-4